jgi:hypothetical protein
MSTLGGVLENVLVALLVAGSVLHSAWRLTSPRLRLRVLDLLEPALGKVAGRWIRPLRTRTLARLTGGCSACSARAGNLRVVKH